MTFNICTVVTGTKERKEGEKIVTIGKEKLFFVGERKSVACQGSVGLPILEPFRRFSNPSLNGGN